MASFEIVEVDALERSIKTLPTVMSADGLYRGSLYNGPLETPYTVKPKQDKANDPLYRDHDGLPVMFPGAAKLRRSIRAERQLDKAERLVVAGGLPNATPIGVKGKKRKPKRVPLGTEASGETYKIRDSSLRWLEFSSYDDYLASDLWKRVKSAAFTLKGDSCCLCCSSAKVIHHHSYEAAVLNGTNLNPLFPMCDSCHRFIEFSMGKKRTLSQTQAFFRGRLIKAISQFQARYPFANKKT